MSDKDFKVKNKLTIAGLTNSSGVLLVEGHTVDSHTNLATQYGGTGTTTSPSSGQILYSSSGTTYAPTTLSSLVQGAKYQADAPSSPSVGDLWIESDSSSDTFDPNIIRRQAFTATAAQTVFTTTVPFIDTYEQVFFNGMLLLRTTDYTTSNSNTITLAAAAAVNDIVEVVTVTNLNSTNTYTQGEIDTALSAKLSTSTAASTYLTQSNASSTYLASSTAASTYLSQSNAATTYVPQTSYSVAGKNKIINGSMDIWQRGTSIAVSGAAVGYVTDRWQVQSNTASVNTTTTRQATGDTTNLPNIQYCARVQRNSGVTANGFISFQQSLETIETIPFVGKTVTLSFYARAGANYSNASSSLGFQLRTGTGTDQNVPAFTGAANPINTSVTLTTNWQRFTASVTLGTSVTQLGLNFYALTTGTAGAADYFEITGVQLEAGSVATPFTTASGSIVGEVTSCQRYFVSYGKNQGDSALSNALGPTGVTTSTTDAVNTYTFPVRMRAIPTLTFSGTANLRGTAGLIGVTGASLGYGTSTQMATVGWTVASGLTAGQWFIIRQTSGGDGAIEFSSEL